MKGMIIRPKFSRFGLEERKSLKQQVKNALNEASVSVIVDIDGLHEAQVASWLVIEMLPAIRGQQITIQSSSEKKIRDVFLYLENKGIAYNSPYEDVDTSEHYLEVKGIE